MIDIIFVWVFKPSKDDTKEIGFGPLNFFCGLKKKFSLNMQDVCDDRGSFIRVDMKIPVATSDWHPFGGSLIKEKPKGLWFLKILKNSCFSNTYNLFCENIYINSACMVFPRRNFGAGAKDTFDYYHSQVIIKIECVFCMLVHRWGMLRKSISLSIFFETNCPPSPSPSTGDWRVKIVLDCRSKMTRTDCIGSSGYEYDIC